MRNALIETVKKRGKMIQDDIEHLSANITELARTAELELNTLKTMDASDQGTAVANDIQHLTRIKNDCSIANNAVIALKNILKNPESKHYEKTS